MAATFEDPMLAPRLRWGILGPGRIADIACTCIKQGSRQDIHAVASRNPQRASEFAARFDIPVSYGSYQELLNDPAVDAVYIATTNNAHHAHALMAITAGKNVVVEKTFALNQREAQEMVDAAAAAGVFIMEGMWTRFLPHMAKIRERIAQGFIGTPLALGADFGRRHSYDPTDRFYGQNHGGGTLLDRGVYPVSIAAHLLGLPTAILATADLAPNGVDSQVAIILSHQAGAQSILHSSAKVATPIRMWIAGTEGMIETVGPFFAPTPLALKRDDGQVERWDHPMPTRGMEFQFAEAARRINANEQLSPLMPPTETVQIMGVLDEIRTQAQVVFPGDA
jgi:predicted dehydrogenase